MPLRPNPPLKYRPKYPAFHRGTNINTHSPPFGESAQSPFWGIVPITQKGDNSQVGNSSAHPSETCPGGCRADDGRSGPKSLVLLLGRSLVLVPVIFLLVSSPALAWTYDCPTDVTAAECERLTYISSQLGDIQQSDTLVWQGVWIVAGFILALMIAPIFVSAFKFWK